MSEWDYYTRPFDSLSVNWFAMEYSSIAIIAIVSLAGFYFHWWLYVRIRRWIDRDLALSLAGQDQAKRAYMLEKLAEAQQQKVPRKDLAGWLGSAADHYPAR